MCPQKGVIVTSSYVDNTLTAFALLGATATGHGTSLCKTQPQAYSSVGSHQGGLVPLWSVGPALEIGPASALVGHGLDAVDGKDYAPATLRLSDDVGASGCLAFTHDPQPRLLVTDAGSGVVHVLDVDDRTLVKCLPADSLPGPSCGGASAGVGPRRPRGVAASGNYIAVSCWSEAGHGDHVVCLFKGTQPYAPLYAVGGGCGGGAGQFSLPRGLCITPTDEVLVADSGNNRVSLFRAGDGVFIRHVAVEREGPCDVKLCQGGVLVARSGAHCVELCAGGSGPADTAVTAPAAAWTRIAGEGPFFEPSALALAFMPLVGPVLLVREWGSGLLQVLTAPQR